MLCAGPRFAKFLSKCRKNKRKGERNCSSPGAVVMSLHAVTFQNKVFSFSNKWRSCSLLLSGKVSKVITLRGGGLGDSTQKGPVGKG
jgi:hypothetical protein